MSSALRKAMLLTHVVCSVGWLGAVAAFFAIAVTGLCRVPAVYVAMPAMTQWVIVPAAYAALITGILLSLGTKWGLVRHYWVLFKLLINGLSLVLLLLHTRIIDEVAAEGGTYASRLQLVEVSGAALAALLIATFLSVYKPRGATPFG